MLTQEESKAVRDQAISMINTLGNSCYVLDCVFQRQTPDLHTLYTVHLLSKVMNAYCMSLQGFSLLKDYGFGTVPVQRCFKSYNAKPKAPELLMFTLDGRVEGATDELRKKLNVFLTPGTYNSPPLQNKIGSPCWSYNSLYKKFREDHETRDIVRTLMETVYTNMEELPKKALNFFYIKDKHFKEPRLVKTTTIGSLMMDWKSALEAEYRASRASQDQRNQV